MDFTLPPGEPALAPHDSVSWKVFKNPIATFVGGVAAVILELAEPRVRTGVWAHSSFRTRPMQRLQRTGLAAMVTVYGAQGTAEEMIAHVVRRHGQVTGFTPSGEAYSANDVDLLTWVQATASFGFVEAYHAYVRPLPREQFDRFYLEGRAAARLYGAIDAPASEADMRTLFDNMRGRLEASPIVFELLNIMRQAPILPTPLRPMQRLLVRAAVEITPAWVRERLGLKRALGLSAVERRFVRWAGRFADRIMLGGSPAVQACQRLGLPADYLYRADP
ncbi:oxygenase MpaB family protein [Variovorax saccharolyticus]|uniref:oxygenase MpaB family protein n=1 Tax=Variovorax saccharolyticus TaxID=3053516 RepID=UPI002578FACA|nr:oxygenase MpaB family protein [Variovorax sp. J31P216]MDM0028321.1 oxygenase MpaB family protein [Variovorax sp. J31P216]